MSEAATPSPGMSRRRLPLGGQRTWSRRPQVEGPLSARRIRQVPIESAILRFVSGLVRIRPPLEWTLPAASFGIARVAFQGGRPQTSGISARTATNPSRGLQRGLAGASLSAPAFSAPGPAGDRVPARQRKDARRDGSPARPGLASIRKRGPARPRKTKGAPVGAPFSWTRDSGIVPMARTATADTSPRSPTRC